MMGFCKILARKAGEGDHAPHGGGGGGTVAACAPSVGFAVTSPAERGGGTFI